MREFYIGDRRIADDEPPYVVAEIGSNHCGDKETAFQLVKEAHACQCDGVKFQRRHNKELYTDMLYNQPYCSENAYGATYGEHREALELPLVVMRECKDMAEGLGMHMFSTAFDFLSVDDLLEIGVPCIKIASGDIKNTPLIRYASTTGTPLIISTGGATLEDCQRAADACLSPFALLHCVASYPNQPHEMNLTAITTMREAFPDTVIGLSDHYNGICMSFAAYVLGASIFEKHFTLNHTWKGTDHALSLQPEGMRRMTRDLKRLMLACGDGVKRLLDSEKGPIYKMGKGLYFRNDMHAGDEVHAEDLDILSPADGLSPHEADKILGRTLACDVQRQQPVTQGVFNV
jgi:N-acetylneuraminate synthase/sialic acid synthase